MKCLFPSVCCRAASCPLAQLHIAGVISFNYTALVPHGPLRIQNGALAENESANAEPRGTSAAGEAIEQTASTEIASTRTETGIGGVEKLITSFIEDSRHGSTGMITCLNLKFE